mmetsp:Transcript_13828/g.36694  ORF Transcript_13828/g.36694 Transcript_13828/m.36694 type:complete len:217 (-) Transcript_13828:472-1122(-)
MWTASWRHASSRAFASSARWRGPTDRRGPTSFTSWSRRLRSGRCRRPRLRTCLASRTRRGRPRLRAAPTRVHTAILGRDDRRQCCCHQRCRTRRQRCCRRRCCRRRWSPRHRRRLRLRCSRRRSQRPSSPLSCRPTIDGSSAHRPPWPCPLSCQCDRTTVDGSACHRHPSRRSSPLAYARPGPPKSPAARLARPTGTPGRRARSRAACCRGRPWSA